MDNKIAITGASGFIGKYLVEHLIEEGYDVIALGRSKAKMDEIFSDEKMTIIETDYSIQHLVRVLQNCYAIVHLAGKRFQKNIDTFLIEPYIDDNLILTQNLLKVAQMNNITRFIQTSTIGVYSAKNELPFSEQQAANPITIYGVSKLTCEKHANLFNMRTNIKITNLRLASLCGIGEKEGVIFTDYLNLALKKNTLQIWGKGETAIDFLYVKDVVKAIEKAIQPDAPSGTFNIGSGRGYTIKEIAESINSVFDNEGNIEFLAEKKEGGYKVYMDSSKSRVELGWKPQYSIIEALKDMSCILGDKKIM